MYRENRTYNRWPNSVRRNMQPTPYSTNPAPSTPVKPTAEAAPTPPVPVPPFVPTLDDFFPFQSDAFTPTELIPEGTLPEAISLPSTSLSEIKLPDSIPLPSIPLPELNLPKSIPMPEVTLPESIKLPSFSLEDLKFPEIPLLTESSKAPAASSQPLDKPSEAQPMQKETKQVKEQPLPKEIAAPLIVVTELPAKKATMPSTMKPVNMAKPLEEAKQPLQVPSEKYAQVRFLNATNVSPLSVLVGTHIVEKSLAKGESTPYIKILGGLRTFTIASPMTAQPMLLRKTFQIQGGEIRTIAIIPTDTGVEFLPISDEPCENLSNSLSCIRVANLLQGSKPLDLMLSDGRVIFADIHHKEVTPFKRIKPGKYQFFVIHTPYQPLPLSEDITAPKTQMSVNTPPDQCEMMVLASFTSDISTNRLYTIYLINSTDNAMPMEVIILES